MTLFWCHHIYLKHTVRLCLQTTLNFWTKNWTLISALWTDRLKDCCSTGTLPLRGQTFLPLNVDCFVSGIYKMLPHPKTILYLDLCWKRKTNHEDSYPLCVCLFCVCREEVNADDPFLWQSDISKAHVGFKVNCACNFELSLCWGGIWHHLNNIALAVTSVWQLMLISNMLELINPVNFEA